MQAQNRKKLFQKSASGSKLSRPFDRTAAASVGRCITLRRTLCGLSQQQLGARLGIDSADVEAYEQGVKRMNCELLLETARKLNAKPRFFFQ
jgi:ribosome-binding protein aMBF1 (putative translation factor)